MNTTSSNVSNVIKKYTKHIWTPSNLTPFNNIVTNSWFNLKETNPNSSVVTKLPKLKTTTGNVIKLKKYRLDLTKEQKKIINNWLDAYIVMYNKTLRYLKSTYCKTGKVSTNFINVRPNLISIRDKIAKQASTKKIKLRVHNLDYAIKLACSNYKSCFSNIRNKNIKNFRIRYWTMDRKTKILDLEKTCFSTLFVNHSLGSIKVIDDRNVTTLTSIQKDFKILYSERENSYYLLVPIDVSITPIPNRSKIISLDPGIRTFMTGLSENKAIEIGNDINSKIIPKLNRLDKIKSDPNIPILKLSKITNRIFRRIHNMIDDLHWKVSNYLTKNYDTILIGNLSSKGIVSNSNSSNLCKLTKRVALHLRFYVFRERLAYKCKERGCKFKVIDESYTSKLCSKCGIMNKTLGSSKIFSCSNCKLIIDRDLNGSKNIYLKSLE